MFQRHFRALNRFHILDSSLSCRMNCILHYRLLLVVGLLVSCFGMFSKRAHPNHESTDQPHKRLRTELADAFLSNSIDGHKTRRIFDLTDQLGIAGFGKLAKAGNRGLAPNHIARDMTRTLLHGSKWPTLYYAPIRCWNAKKQKIVVHWLPFILPHEALAQMYARCSDVDKLYCVDNMSKAAQKHLEFAKKELNKQKLIGLGIWGDGCPVKFDRSESLEVFCWSLPGGAGELKNMRVPITAIHKHFCHSHDSLDDILSVVAWSFRCLAQGRMPGCRHDGSAWKQSDSKRAKSACQRKFLQQLLWS